MDELSYGRAAAIRAKLDDVEKAAGGNAAGQKARYRARQKLSAEAQALLRAAEHEDAIRAEVKGMRHSKAGAEIRRKIAADRYRASLLDPLAALKPQSAAPHPAPAPAAIDEPGSNSAEWQRGFRKGNERARAVIASEFGQANRSAAAKLLGNAKLSTDEIVETLADMPDPQGQARFDAMLAKASSIPPVGGHSASEIQAMWARAAERAQGRM